jgi:hypothetical protein
MRSQETCKPTMGMKMQRVGKSKVTKLKAKADTIYPLIRLPKRFADEIGKTAEIFETEHNDKHGLFITFDEAAVPPEVIQPSAKVIQLNSSERIKNRLQELESEIKELQSIIILNECDSLHGNQKSKAEGEIRTRVVASTGP